MSAEQGEGPPSTSGNSGGRKRVLMIIAAIAVVVVLVVAAVALVGWPKGSNNSDLAVPSAPSSLKVQGTSEDYFFLVWDEPSEQGGSEITSYKLYCSAGSPINCTFNWTIGSHTGKAIYSNEINLGWTYSFYVVAMNAQGESAHSNTLAFTAYFTPSMIDIKDLDWGNCYVNLSWSPPTSDGGKPVTGYRVQRTICNDLNAAPVNFTLGIDARSMNDTSVLNGVTYQYNVGAINEVGTGNAWSMQVKPGAPGKVGDIIFLPGNGYVDLIWGPPSKDGGSPITKYQICRYLSSDFDIPPLVVNVSGTTESYNDTGVTNGVNYCYNIYAFNALGGSGNDWGRGGLVVSPSASMSSRVWNYTANDYSVGDFAYYELTLGSSYGGGLAWRINKTIDKVSALTVTMNVTKVCVAYGNLTLYDDIFCLKTYLFMGDNNFNYLQAQLVGSEVLTTKWGDISADHWTMTDNWGATYEVWIHQGIMIKTQSYTSGSLNGETLMVDTNLSQITGI